MYIECISVSPDYPTSRLDIYTGQLAVNTVASDWLACLSWCINSLSRSIVVTLYVSA